MDYTSILTDIVKLQSYNSVVLFIILCVLVVMLIFNILQQIFR